tara:strand:- start:512 stop:1282 length:771 start_codon:yes stop_codon:yes gene_type:complete
MQKLLRYILVAATSFAFNSSHAQVIELENDWPIKSDAIVKGEAELIPVVEVLREAVGDDAWVIFADEADETIQISFEGPKWATDTINESLIQAGLKAIWIGTTLVVYGDNKPYIVGHTPRSLRKRGGGSYIVPANSVINVFSQVSAEWGRAPMIDDPLENGNLRFAYALKFSGKTILDDFGELENMVDKLAGGDFTVSTDFVKGTAIMTLNQPDQPQPQLAERYDCYQRNQVDKTVVEIRLDMEECKKKGVWVRHD